MTKKEIASKIADQSGISRLLALEAVQMVFDGIIQTLVNDGRVLVLEWWRLWLGNRRAKHQEL